MTKSYQICCPKCNNHQNFYRYGKDKNGNQKYLCRVCGHPFVPDSHAAGKPGRPRVRPYPTCPVCGKAMFLHHDHKYYSNYQCCDKKCGHSIFVPKPAAVTAPSMSKLSGKTDFKRMRYPVYVILTALSMFCLGQNSLRNIALILRTVMNIQVSHTTISNWCTKFAPLFQNIALELMDVSSSPQWQQCRKSHNRNINPF